MDSFWLAIPQINPDLRPIHSQSTEFAEKPTVFMLLTFRAKLRLEIMWSKNS